MRSRRVQPSMMIFALLSGLFLTLSLVSTVGAEPGPAQPSMTLRPSIDEDAPRAGNRSHLVQSFRVPLSIEDQRTALYALNMALDRIGDGESFTWQRSSRGLRGMVRAVTSFRDVRGRICRRIATIVSVHGREKAVQGTACRHGGGAWSLEG